MLTVRWLHLLTLIPAVHSCLASSCSISLSLSKSPSSLLESTLLLWRQAKYCGTNVPRSGPQPTTQKSWCLYTPALLPLGWDESEGVLSTLAARASPEGLSSSHPQWQLA